MAGLPSILYSEEIFENKMAACTSAKCRRLERMCDLKRYQRSYVERGTWRRTRKQRSGQRLLSSQRESCRVTPRQKLRHATSPSGRRHFRNAIEQFDSRTEAGTSAACLRKWCPVWGSMAAPYFSPYASLSAPVVHSAGSGKSSKTSPPILAKMIPSGCSASRTRC